MCVPRDGGHVPQCETFAPGYSSLERTQNSCPACGWACIYSRSGLPPGPIDEN